jgi:signal transduction histidine kinase
MLVVLENVSAAVFVLLGIATGIGWLRRKDASMGWLALAIILLSFVFLVGRLMVVVPVITNVASEISVFAFVGSAYALLRFRGSLIPLSRNWHIAAVVAIAAGIGGVVASQLLGLSRALASRNSGGDRPGAELGGGRHGAHCSLLAGRTRAAGGPGLATTRAQPGLRHLRRRLAVCGRCGDGRRREPSGPAIAVQLAVIATAPLLYMSFSPPAWLRREWRGSEEEGLRKFMEELLLTEHRDALADRALEWSMGLVGGAAAAAFDGDGSVRTSRGLSDAQLAELKSSAPSLERGLSRIALAGSETTVIALPIAGLADSGTLVVLAGPFTPGFGADELSRVQQFMSAFVTALDRRHLIVELKESHTRLQEANRHKSVFVASMSHELRTPLNAILGFSELLMDADDGQYSTTTSLRFLEQIHSSGKHLLGLINDILDLSKIEAGQMELRVQMVSVAELIRQTLSTIEPLAVQKQIQIQAGDLEAGEIVADAGKFKQMLLNLMSNAVKFSPEGAVVTISAVRLENTVEVSVADRGIGIAREDQERVFHEFQQVDSGVGRQQTGTGLGLTLPADSPTCMAATSASPASWARAAFSPSRFLSRR